MSTRHFEPNDRAGCVSCNLLGDARGLPVSLRNSRLGPSPLINAGPNTSRSNQAIKTVIPRRIQSLEVDARFINPGWRQDVLAYMSAGIIAHLSSRLNILLPSPQFVAVPFLALLASDSPSGTYLDRNNSTSVTGSALRKPSDRPFSTMTKKQKYDNITHIPSNILPYSLPYGSGVFLAYCVALRFDDEPDYSYLRKLFRDLFVPEYCQNVRAFEWETQGLSNPSDKATRGKVACSAGRQV
ncbi:hypothetical protein BDV93DRAFT_528645 [Ceratobasidium sp. AG-I]|nr:hypothetical protein BDV93DRAFT_528645 [Ceratobasidium sp. AG-I]